WTYPVRLLPVVFALGIVLGTALLMLPISYRGPGAAGFMPAAFTSASAVTVTGLTTVDTSTYWSPFGQGVILALIQVGGFGFMTLATLLGVAVGGRLGLRTRLITQAEMGALNLGEVRPLLRRVAVTMVIFELAVALVLAVRYRLEYAADLSTAIWHG